MRQGREAERGFLVSVGVDPEILVRFQFNPAQLADKRAVNYATLTAPGQLVPVRQYSQGGDRSLSFTVRVDAAFPGGEPAVVELDDEGSILPELNKYRAFLYPQTPRWRDAGGTFQPLYDAGDAGVFRAPPTCRFGFGSARVIDCVVTEIAITELLFDAGLRPLRADVAVTLMELAAYGNEPTPVPGGA